MVRVTSVLIRPIDGQGDERGGGGTTPMRWEIAKRGIIPMRRERERDSGRRGGEGEGGHHTKCRAASKQSFEQ
jgi:hypothetical protein